MKTIITDGWRGAGLHRSNSVLSFGASRRALLIHVTAVYLLKPKSRSETSHL
jgi:hypothetical protein